MQRDCRGWRRRAIFADGTSMDWIDILASDVDMTQSLVCRR
jgi:hypothetical protein